MVDLGENIYIKLRIFLLRLLLFAPSCPHKKVFYFFFLHRYISQYKKPNYLEDFGFVVAERALKFNNKIDQTSGNHDGVQN